MIVNASTARLIAVAVLATIMHAMPEAAWGQSTQVKALGRFNGWRENSLIGYGVVVGLAGSGDSPRSAITRQALQNVYARLGVNVGEADIASHNVAVVVVIASLPASANVGDRIDATASSTGDARSLAGGTLLMTPLMGPDGRAYALAQGPLVAGGDSFERQLNLSQRNYPTTARLDGGASVERAVDARVAGDDGVLEFLLNEPSFTTASRIAGAINAHFGAATAHVENADEVRVNFDAGATELASFVSAIENLSVDPDRTPRIVINERTGTVVAGADVLISSVIISQGDVRVTVSTEVNAAQPSFIDGFNPGVHSLIVTNTDLDVDRSSAEVVARFPNTSVADLVEGLSRAHVDTRRLISILQAMRAAGALHAEIIVQ